MASSVIHICIANEINKTIEKIRASYKVVEVKGKEEFYKIT